MVHKTQDEDKNQQTNTQNTEKQKEEGNMCWTPLYARQKKQKQKQKNANNVNKTRAFLQTTGS